MIFLFYREPRKHREPDIQRFILKFQKSLLIQFYVGISIDIKEKVRVVCVVGG